MDEHASGTESSQVTLNMTASSVVETLDLEPAPRVQADDGVVTVLTWLRQGRLPCTLVCDSGAICGLFSPGALIDHLVAVDDGAHVLRVDDESSVEDFMVARPFYIDEHSTIRECVDALSTVEACVLNYNGEFYIITSQDVSEFLNIVTEPFILIQEIETSLRSLIEYRLALTPQLAISRALRHRYKDDSSIPTDFKFLALGELVQVILQKQNFDELQGVFGKSRVGVDQRLRSLPPLRNQVFHFRKPLALPEVERLRRQREWLLSKSRRVAGL